MGNFVFVFIRWSHHFSSIYTSQLTFNLTSLSAHEFPFLHLLPMDINTYTNLSDLALYYQQSIFNSGTLSFSDDVS